MRRKHALFVSFSYTKGSSFGFGNKRTSVTSKKLTSNDIDRIEKDIKYENDFDGVAILNYQYM